MVISFQWYFMFWNFFHNFSVYSFNQFHKINQSSSYYPLLFFIFFYSTNNLRNLSFIIKNDHSLRQITLLKNLRSLTIYWYISIFFFIKISQKQNKQNFLQQQKVRAAAAEPVFKRRRQRLGLLYHLKGIFSLNRWRMLSSKSISLLHANINTMLAGTKCKKFT